MYQTADIPIIILGACSVIAGIALLFRLGVKRSHHHHADFNALPEDKKSPLAVWIARIESQKINRRNYRNPQTLSDRERAQLAKTSVSLRKLAGCVLVILGILFLFPHLFKKRTDPAKERLNREPAPSNRGV